MKKELLLTILSSIALILLQVFWINSMYQKYENQYTEKINKAFFNAIEKEGNYSAIGHDKFSNLK